MSTSRVYVGGLDSRTVEKDLGEAFKPFGKIITIDMKEVRGHGKYFAFVEFEDDRDAQDAITALNGKKIGSSENVSVEPSKPPRSTNRRNGGDRGGDRGVYGDRGRRRGVQHSRYQLVIENLPDRVSWQELKNFASGPRQRWNCIFADVDDRKHIGRVEYDHPDDMEDAYRMLHKERWDGFTIYTYKINSRNQSPSPPPPRRDGRRGGSRNDSPLPPRSP